MAFADPQSVTIGTVPGAVSLPRTGSGTSSGIFTSNDGTAKMSVSHTYGNRTRRVARLDFSKITTDPLTSGNNIAVGMSAYLVVDVPLAGFSVSEQTDVVKGLLGNLSASTYAAVTKLLGGES